MPYLKDKNFSQPNIQFKNNYFLKIILKQIQSIEWTLSKWMELWRKRENRYLVWYCSYASWKFMLVIHEKYFY